MSAVRSGSSLRALVLTPDRIPDFFIPSRSPLLFLSPRRHRSSPDRTRLLSDHEDDSLAETPPGTPLGPPTSRRLCLPPPPQIRRLRRIAAAAECPHVDTDLTTYAAMSLPHVEKLTSPYGFRAVLATSPHTCRRESLFHQNKPVTVPDLQDPANPPPGPGPGPSRSQVCPVTVTVTDLQDPVEPPPPGSGRSKSRVRLRPLKALGLQVMKDLKRPATTLKALSPAPRKTRPADVT